MTWSTCSCGHIAQEHDATVSAGVVQQGPYPCSWPGCSCKDYDGHAIHSSDEESPNSSLEESEMTRREERAAQIAIDEQRRMSQKTPRLPGSVQKIMLDGAGTTIERLDTAAGYPHYRVRYLDDARSFEFFVDENHNLVVELPHGAEIRTYPDCFMATIDRW